MNELLEKFELWYKTGEYLEQATPITWMHNCNDLHIKDKLIKQIFMLGVDLARKQTIEVLQELELKTCGLDPEMLTPDEVFERARTNLEYFYDADR